MAHSTRRVQIKNAYDTHLSPSRTAPAGSIHGEVANVDRACGLHQNLVIKSCTGVLHQPARGHDHYRRAAPSRLHPSNVKGCAIKICSG